MNHEETLTKSFIENTLEKMKRENITLQQALKIDDSLTEELYALAFSHYSQGRYEEALQLFQLLLGLNPRSAKYHFGMGSAHYQLHHYKDATVNFVLALSFDPSDPQAAYYASECFAKEGEKEAALHCLDLVEQIAGDQTAHAYLKERALLVKKTLRM